MLLPLHLNLAEAGIPPEPPAPVVVISEPSARGSGGSRGHRHDIFFSEDFAKRPRKPKIKKVSRETKQPVFEAEAISTPAPVQAIDQAAIARLHQLINEDKEILELIEMGIL